MPEPTMTPVISSNVHSIGRCDDGHLWVQFKDNNGGPGRLYRYDGEAAEHHDAMLASPSVGRYFATTIKGKLNGSRQDG